MNWHRSPCSSAPSAEHATSSPRAKIRSGIFRPIECPICAALLVVSRLALLLSLIVAEVLAFIVATQFQRPSVGLLAAFIATLAGAGDAADDLRIFCGADRRARADLPAHARVSLPLRARRGCRRGLSRTSSSGLGTLRCMPDHIELSRNVAAVRFVKYKVVICLYFAVWLGLGLYLLLNWSALSPSISWPLAAVEGIFAPDTSIFRRMFESFESFSGRAAGGDI